MHPDRINLRANKPLVLAVLATCAAALVSIPVTAAPPAAKKAAAKAAAGGTSTNDGNKSGVQSFRGEVAPAMPTNVTVMPLTRRGFQIRWKDNSPNEVGYEIERVPAFSGGVIRLGANATSYLDTQNIASAQYRVRARGDTLTSDWTGLIQGSSVASSFVLLPNGPGFSGGTTVFAVGTPDMPGYDAKAIARWDVVPYQTFSDEFLVGVVAFHVNGIDRVEFSVNGGDWKQVREMQLNPLTNVREYTARLQASGFADGPVEIRAVVYPKDAGIPRVLGGAIAAGLATGEHSIFLTANSHNSLPSLSRYVSPSGDDTADGSASAPYRTIMKAARAIQNAQGTNADGGTIFLTAGDHVLGTYQYSLSTLTTDRWLTIASAPGLNKSQVRIIRTGTDGLRTKLVHLSNLTLAPATGADQAILTSNVPLEDYFWVDGCDFVGPGRAVSSGWNSGLTAQFITNCTAKFCRDAPVGAIVRDMVVEDIGSDAFTGAALAINSTVSRIDSSGTTFHADVFQFYSGTLIENRIAYGIVANIHDGQGFFAGNGIALKDIAFVNCEIDNQYGAANTASVFMFGGPIDHMLVRNSIFVGSTFWRSDFAFTARNVVVDHSFSDHVRSQFLFPNPDRSAYSGTLPWISPISVLYRDQSTPAGNETPH